MKVYIDTLGCPKNISDSEHAAGILMESGHTIAESPENADVILVNTCGFINDAKEESIDRILELSEQKTEDAVLVVSGCLSQRYKEDLCKAMPEAQIIIGVNEYEKLPQLLRDYRKGKQLSYFDDWMKEYSETGVRMPLTAAYTSYLKIAEGCNNICAYCIFSKFAEDIGAERLITSLLKHVYLRIKDAGSWLLLPRMLLPMV